MNFGKSIAPVFVSHMTLSSVTGWFRGAPCSFQSGISSVRALGSITAPLRMWAPGSEPFSSTTTETSLSWAAASCFSLIAVARPPGPPPTMTTSYAMASRGPCWARSSGEVMRGSGQLDVGEKQAARGPQRFEVQAGARRRHDEAVVGGQVQAVWHAGDLEGAARHQQHAGGAGVQRGRGAEGGHARTGRAAPGHDV